MSSSASAKALAFDDSMMWVSLTDGRVLGVPLDFFPRLLNATPDQRAAYWIGYEGGGLHWDEIDEDISVAGLIAGRWDNTRLGREHRAAQVKEQAAAGRTAMQAAEAPPVAAE